MTTLHPSLSFNFRNFESAVDRLNQCPTRKDAEALARKLIRSYGVSTEYIAFVSRYASANDDEREQLWQIAEAKEA